MNPEQEGTGLSQQVGPLKLWQWGGIIVIVAAGYLWWANRNSSSGGVQSADSGYTTADVNSGDYGSGYDNGYMAGLNANGFGQQSGGGGTTQTSQGNAQGPIAHNRFTAQVKNPAGHKQTVTGYGTWIRKNGRWVWQVGIPRQFALAGNGAGTGASNTAQDVQAQMAQGATGSADAAPAAAAADTSPGAASTLDQATGTAGVGTSGGGATSQSISGAQGTSQPARTATTAQRIAQIVKDLQNPGPNFTQAQQQSYLSTYKSLTGHAYTGKLGQLQVGQHVQYATV